MDEPTCPPDPEEIAEAVLDRLRTRLSDAFGLREPWLEDLVAESRPPVHALLFAASLDRAGDPETFEHHEGIAMVTLLGRRAGDLGIPTSAALALVPILLTACRAEGSRLPEGLEDTLRSACMEGYVLGREDRLRDASDRRAGGAIATLQVAPGVLALVLAGEQAPEQVEAAVEAFGRALFKAEARAAIVEVSGLLADDPALASAVFGAEATLRTLGIPCLFSGPGAPLVRDAEEAGIDTSYVEVVPGFAEALARLGVTGGAVERALLPSLRRLFDRR